MPGAIQIRLLGRVQIEHDGVPVTGFESRKALALICYLAVQDQAISRNELAALFWSDKSTSQSRANLSRVLHNNAEVLPDCLQIERNTVQLIRSERCWIDVAEFVELAAQDELDSLVAAAELFQGDLMQGYSVRQCPEFEIWLLTQQEVWRQRAARVLQRLIDLHCDRGEYEHGLSFAAQLVALDPWREEAHRRMMLMLALSGQRVSALLQYETCCRILANELGVTPCEETTALYHRIQSGLVDQTSILVAQDSFSTPTAWPQLPVPVAVLERKEEVQQVRTRLDDRTCHLLTVVGRADESAAQLAIQVAQDRRRAFRDGVYVVTLSANGSNGTFLATVGDAVKLTPGTQTDLKVRLMSYLREKDLLLVITDFDPAFGQAALLEDIVKRAPRVKILVTSRKPLNLPTEWIFDL